MRVKTFSCRVVEDQEFEYHLSLEEIYDENNNLLQSTDYSIEGKVRAEASWEYKDDLMVLYRNVDHVSGVQNYSQFSYRDGMIVEEKDLFEDDAYQVWKYEYNEENKLVASFLTDENQAYLGEEKVIIDGLKQTKEIYDDNHFMYREEKSLFDEANNLIEREVREIFSDVKGGMDENVIFEYYEYNRNNKLIFQRSEKDGVKVFEAKFTYDHKGRGLTDEIWSIEEEGLTTVQYKYDSRDNLIQESIYKNDVLKEETIWHYDAKNRMRKVDTMALATDDYPFRMRYYYEYSEA